MIKYRYIIILSLIFHSCSEENNHRLFSNLSANETNIDFSNKLSIDGELNILNYIYYFNGGGVAAGDINNDGLIDLYFTGNEVSNQLYLNKGNFKFEDITSTSGTATQQWSTGVTMADINSDGWLDIYVSVSGSPNPEKRKNLLFINNQDETFTEMAEAYGLADNSYSTHATFFDYDLDGDLDMYLLNHMHEMNGLNNPKKRKLLGESESTDKLYRNNGISESGHPIYEDVSTEVGITVEGFGLGVGISDINQDGFPDIYVSNDFITNDILYINQSNGTFKNDIASSIKHQSHNGMGNDIADINNDGLTDILVMDMLPATNAKKKTMLSKPNYDLYEYGKYMGYEPQYMRNTLQLNNGVLDGETKFSEIGQLSGISSTDWSWAGLFADFDLDGKKDLYVSNGYIKDMTDLDFIVYKKRHSMFTTKEKSDSIYLSSITKLPEIKQQNYFYKNNGDLTFEDVSLEWAEKAPTFSNGAVYVDLDNDGDLDIIANNINEKATVLKNKSVETKSSNTHLTIKFKGSKENTFGIGAKVWAYVNNQIQYAENYTTRGFQSSMAPQLYFGIPNNVKIDSLKVMWPDGKSETTTDVISNSIVTFDYKNATLQNPDSIHPTKLFTEVSQEKHINFYQKEYIFPDFKREPLIPQNYSNNGPSIAVADINGDDLDDFYVSGSFQFSGKLFKQNTNGSFDTIPVPFNKNLEDLGALFFDADNDGDNDLYIVSGSTEIFDVGYLQDRLYTNDGKGNFTETKNTLPEINSSGSAVTAADYDKDGDLDLFIGSRVVPGKYGENPISHLLQNTNGTFKDVTSSVLGSDKLGMISSSLWTDYNNDGWVDLILVGEWMPITIYKNNNGNLSEKIEIENSNGFWNSINGGDFDNDGDIDYILGNLGENAFFKASNERPIILTLGDFDKDTKNDPIISTYSKDEDGEYRSYPFAPRDLLADQMVLIKNKYRTYQQYSKAQIEDFTSVNSDYETFEVNHLKNTYLENLGNGEFKMHALPIEAQFAPVMGTTIKDFDLDGNLDVLLIGNFYHAEVGYGQYDASIGLYLKGNGKGEFEPVNVSESGFIVDGDARALVQLQTKDEGLILASQNNSDLKVYKPVESSGKTIRIDAKITHAIITLKNGKKRKVEFYRGEGYLSQSSRHITISNDATLETFSN
ncbi:VCBS repeat protein [Flavobacteriaceae bacterium MAR_2010_72]|nr:VCBS repeat protein [Flavobacteriaceae bacterium MAR_2010_72]